MLDLSTGDGANVQGLVVEGGILEVGGIGARLDREIVGGPLLGVVGHGCWCGCLR